MKRIVCEDTNGNEILSFDFKEDIEIQNYGNCEIADVILDGNLTIIKLQAIK